MNISVPDKTFFFTSCSGLVLCCLVLASSISVAYAQRAGAPPLSIPKEDNRKKKLQFKAPASEAALPPAGDPFTVKVNLLRTKDTSHLLQAYIVKDGKYEERTIGDAYLNEYDIPTYDIHFNAPVAQLQMQFLVTTEDGERIWSRSHSVQRSCIKDSKIVDLTEGADAQVKDRIPILIEQAGSLESELHNYEQALKLMKQLQAKFSSGDES